MLPVFEKPNGLFFYPVQYEGEESSKNVIYTGAAPNQQAIPAVEYLMTEVGVKRWVLEGTDYVYPRTTNRILEAYLVAKGVAAADISINYTPFGHSDWQTRVADIKRFGSAGKKTAVVSTINGDANVPFYKEFANQKISAEDIPVVAFSVGEEELSGLDAKPLVGHLAAWNYFQSISSPANSAFIEQWKTYIKKANRTTNDPMEAHFIGFNLWVKAVEKAKTTDVEQVLAALPGLETPNLTGGIARMLAESPHHQAGLHRRGAGGRPVRRRLEDDRHGAGRRVVGLPAGQQADRGRLGDAEVRELQHDDEGLLGSELQVNSPTGGQWLDGCCSPPSRVAGPGASPRTRPFAAALGGAARGEPFSTRRRLPSGCIATGHPGTRAVLTALLEDRLYVRTATRRSSSSRRPRETLPSYELVDPVSLARRGRSAPPDSLIRIGTNNRLRALAAERRSRVSGSSSPDAAVRLAAVKEHAALARRSRRVALLREREDVEPDAASEAKSKRGSRWPRSTEHDPASAARAIEHARRSARLRRSQPACAPRREVDRTAAFAEPDAAVRTAAASALQSIDSRTRLLGHRDAVLRSQPRLGARAGRDRPRASPSASWASSTWRTAS